MLAGFLAGDDNDELGDLATVHPLFELRHDLLDVRLDLVVGSHYVGQLWAQRHSMAYTPIIVSPYFLTLGAVRKCHSRQKSTTDSRGEVFGGIDAPLEPAWVSRCLGLGALVCLTGWC